MPTSKLDVNFSFLALLRLYGTFYILKNVSVGAVFSLKFCNRGEILVHKHRLACNSEVFYLQE